MKRRLFDYIVVLSTILLFSGCTSSKSTEKKSIVLDKGSFSITCSTELKDTAMNQQIKVTYNFNDHQYAINYDVVTTQKFNKKSVYDTYKEAQIETTKSATDEILYDLETDDKNLTLIFTMAIPNINLDDYSSEEEKNTLKASQILKRIENTTDAKYKCKIKGINRDKLN